LDRDGIEHFRKRTEDVLTRMTQEAEAWAEAGTSKQDQIKVAPAPRPLPTPGKDFLLGLLGDEMPAEASGPPPLRRAA
jgi:hypothetical protein